MKKVNLFVSHPIQYHIPWYRELAKFCDFKVYFSHLPTPRQQSVGFGKEFSWDIPLLDGYQYEVLNLPRFAGRFYISGGLLRKIQLPDAVILNGWVHWSDFQLLNYFKDKNIPIIVRGESNSLRRRSLIQKVIHRQFMNRYDAYLAIGSSNRKFYLDNGVSSKKIFETKYFVENVRIRTQFEEAYPLRKELRKRWSVPDGAFCFLYSGKLQPKKRILDILKAINELKDLSNLVRLLVMGDGELMNAAKKYVAETGLPVTFTGFLNQTEITKAYAAADCLVLASDYGETWGLVVNEAMVCGLPVITSDRVGSHPDLIQEGKTGFTFPFANTHKLTEKMKWMLDHPDQSRVMGECARQLIKSCSVEKTVSATMLALDYVSIKKV